jgi:hypothetical protein
MQAHPKEVSYGHYYTCYALQTCQPQQNLQQQCVPTILPMDSAPAIASHKLQTNLDPMVKDMEYKI